jgi:hypothetical protein
MRLGIRAEHWVDDHLRPAGGSTFGNGFAISWQHGPLGRGAKRKEPNGAFVEDIIAAAVDRIEFYQRTEFNCDENAVALEHLQKALTILDERTQKREARQVEGTHSV